MKHIRQNISGDKCILTCEKCGVREVVTITSRANLDTNIKVFERAHKHPGKEK